MFSNESLKHAEACRNCWMCRHICPTSNATGMEAWSPRVRGYMVSMVERGFEYDEVMVEDMYMCCLCDACADDCCSDIKPNIFIREGRTHAVANGLAPKAVMDAIDVVEKTGNLFGAAMNADVKAAAAALPAQADVVLFLGETAATVAPSVALAAISLLKKAGVNFTVLQDEPASGSLFSELIGYTGDIQEQAKKAAAAIAATGAKTVVALDPYDACIFTEKYAQWNLLADVQVVTATSFVADLVADGKLQPKAVELTASYHDPDRLSRGVGETEPAREVIKALGVNVIEMFLNRNLGRSCGGPVMNVYAPDVVKKIVDVREQDAIRMGSNCIITASPSDYYVMTTEGGTVSYQDLFALLDANC